MDQQISTNQTSNNSEYVVPSATSTSNSSSVPPKNSKNKSGFIFLLIVILLLMGSGILVLSLYKKEIPTVDPELVIDQQSSLIPDTLSDWQLYQGNGYTFKHPKDVDTFTETAGKDTDSISVVFIGPTQKASGRTQTELFDGYSFSVTNMGVSSENSSSELVAKERMQNVDACSQTDPVTDISEVQTMVLAGHTAYQFTSIGCFADFTLTYLDDGSNVFRITQLYTGTPDVYESYKRTTDQILSTFAFTDKPTTSVCPLNYVISDNNYYSICLPSDFEQVKEMNDMISSAEYKNTDKIIQITKNFEGGWGGLWCAKSEKVSISGYPSERIIYIDGSEDACESHYTSFWSLINNGVNDGPFPIYIFMSSVNGDVVRWNEDDLNTYKTIEQSFKVKN